MVEDRCVVCGNIVPEGRMVCPQCENAQIKIGMILQSVQATEEHVKEVYGIKEKENGKDCSY